jgi:hypothetical protein
MAEGKLIAIDFFWREGWLASRDSAIITRGTVERSRSAFILGRVIPIDALPTELKKTAVSRRSYA